MGATCTRKFVSNSGRLNWSTRSVSSTPLNPAAAPGASPPVTVIRDVRFIYVHKVDYEALDHLFREMLQTAWGDLMRVVFLRDGYS